MVSVGFAAKLRGSPRQLRDIDLDIPDKYLEKVAKIAEKHVAQGPEKHESRAFKNNILKLEYNGVKIDIGGRNRVSNIQ
jgi:hypothetical protein